MFGFSRTLCRLGNYGLSTSTPATGTVLVLLYLLANREGPLDLLTFTFCMYLFFVFWLLAAGSTCESHFCHTVSLLRNFNEDGVS